MLSIKIAHTSADTVTPCRRAVLLKSARRGKGTRVCTSDALRLLLIAARAAGSMSNVYHVIGRGRARMPTMDRPPRLVLVFDWDLDDAMWRPAVEHELRDRLVKLARGHGYEPVPVHVWNEDEPIDDDTRVAGWLDAVTLCMSLPIPDIKIEGA
jgi:hypothetical protein